MHGRLKETDSEKGDNSCHSSANYLLCILASRIFLYSKTSCLFFGFFIYLTARVVR